MPSVVTILASIPSPSSGTIEIGPLTIHMYGLMLLLGIAACIFITGRRWVARGGDWDLIFRVAVWGVGAGIVGARLYHLLTSWDEVPDEWWGPFAVWEGGLGIWGGIAGGVLVGGIVAKRAGASVTALLDAAAPGLLVAQAIGRVGNWWNQELFGEPTNRPWGLEIDPARRPDDYVLSDTFHPTFLYEGLWCLAAAGLLLLLDRRYTFRPPALFALYVALYTGFRFYLETLRIDPSEEIAGWRVNSWVSAVLFVASVAFFVYWQVFRGRRRGRREPATQPPRTMAVPRGRVRPRR
jgi:phosphatidylglycerol---prolipoprotein diacylglyceryl transferase